jgi:DNA-binding winged helix-turn-helix (wHTH) protein
MADPSAVCAERIYPFGSFRLLPSRRLLLDGETPVCLGGRASEILVALAEQPCELVR